MLVNAATKPTVLFAVWLVAYVVIGGAVFLVSNQLIERTAMHGLSAIIVSAALKIALGWFAASWVQRWVATRLGMPGSSHPAA